MVKPVRTGAPEDMGLLFLGRKHGQLYIMLLSSHVFPFASRSPNTETPAIAATGRAAPSTIRRTRTCSGTKVEEEDDDDGKLSLDSLVVSVDGEEEASGNCLAELDALFETNAKSIFWSLAVTHTQNAVRKRRRLFISCVFFF